jgi:hypothetical protein
MGINATYNNIVTISFNGGGDQSARWIHIDVLSTPSHTQESNSQL